MPIAQSSGTGFKVFLEDVSLEKVTEKLADSQKGSRLFPVETGKKERESNYRIEAGAKLPDGRQEIVVRANRNAKDKNVRKRANKKGSELVAKATVTTDKSESEADPMDLKAELLKSFKENN